MKKIVFIFLLIATVSVGTYAFAQQKGAGFFRSKTKTYQVEFPVPPGSETGKAYKSLNDGTKLISHVAAEYKSEELGSYAKYTLSIEPLKQYKPPADAVEERIDELITFYEKNYNFEVIKIDHYDKNDRWGTDITIEFFDKNVSTSQLRSNDQIWAVRRRVFFEATHVVLLEAIGSQDYIYSNKTEHFFDSFRFNEHFAAKR